MIVFLVGYMGCGKTTIGRRLARRLGYDFADTDDRIEKQEGADVCDIFHYAGEEYFRKAERGMLEQLIASGDDLVVSTGGGVVGVLATARSLDGDLFRRTAARYGENIRVLTAVGEGFVELVEEDREQSPEAVETVRRVLEPMIREGADQIVLGCTHYPFLLPVFRQVIGERGVAVVDPSPAVGRRVGQLLDQYDLRAEKGATANYGFLTFADEAYRSRLECKAFG